MNRMSKEVGNWIFEFTEEWSQFFDDCNWYDMHLLQAYVENDYIMGAYEVQVMLLGVGFRIRWNHTETELRAELAERVLEILGDGSDGKQLTTAPIRPCCGAVGKEACMRYDQLGEDCDG